MPTKKSPVSPKRFYYFNSTHWDREWYQPLQKYRHYLVQNAAGILDALERAKDFQKFVYDGQTIVLEDICEIRPEWRKRLEKQIMAGRLIVGPWYVMPDEFLCTGEGIIRNLLIGKELARSYGHDAWPVMYVCDIFGHIAQTPQIAAGFGHELAVIWRGTTQDFPPYFQWESPDGTQMPTMKLSSTCGYCSFTLEVNKIWDIDIPEAQFKENFAKLMENIGPYFGEGVALLDGCDHQQVHHQTPQYLKWIQEMYPKAEVIHSDFRDIVPNEFGAKAKRPVIAGELIHTCEKEPNNTWMIPHTLSSRYDLKQWEDRCADRLELSADIVQAAEVVRGNAETVPFLKYAWKQLIKNHPHDSICGCSIDAVHRQMLARFEEIDQLADELELDPRNADFERLTGTDIRLFEYPADENGDYLLRLYNPLPFARDEVLETTLSFPAGKYPATWSEPFGYEFLNAYRIYDEAGNELPYQFISPIRRRQNHRIYRVHFTFCDDYPVAFRVKLRACGWTTLKIRKSATPVRYQVSQLTTRGSASNGRLELTVNGDGTISIFDFKTNKAYLGLNQFVFDRDIGDGWNYVKPQGTAVQVAGGVVERISVVTDGPAETAFAVVTRFTLPREMVFEGGILENYEGVRESADLADLVVKATYTLTANAPEVRVALDFTNTIKDYRLRMVMPTNISGDYYAYQNFAVLKRKPGREKGRATENWLESEPLEKNFSRIAWKRDDEGGLAFIAKEGLHELSADTDAEGALAVTLLLAFRRTVHTNGEIDGQLLKPLHYEYAFRAIAPEDTTADLLRDAQCLRAGVPIQYMVPQFMAKKELPEDESFVAIEGDLALSALKPAEDGQGRAVILRVEALSDKPVKGIIRLAKPARVTPVRLDETPIGKTSAPVTSFKVTGQPWHLQTYRLEF